MNPSQISEFLNSIEMLQPREKTLQRGDFLITPGEVERFLYYIEQGAIHAFYVSDSEEHTIRLGYSGSLITSIPSFYDGSPSQFYMQAIRKTVVRTYDRQAFFKAMGAHPALKEIYQKSLEALAGQQMEREIDLLTASPFERLTRVMKRSPRVFQEIPLKYIASYLRMTPETLSRIMNS